MVGFLLYSARDECCEIEYICTYIYTYIHWLERLCRNTYSIPIPWVLVVIVIGPEADLGMF